MIAFIDIRKTLLFRMVESEGTKKPWQPRRVMSEGADLSDADTGMRYVIAYSVS